MSNVRPLVLTNVETLGVGCFIIGAVQVFVSAKLLLSHAYSGRQKALQLLIVWLLPLLGALFVFLFMQNDAAHHARADTRFVPAAGQNPEGLGSGSEHA